MACLSAALRSGSSGNSILVRTESATLVVDLGMSGRQFERALDRFDLTPSQIDGILLTHEHRDHLSGLGVVMRRHHIPLYVTLPTLEAALPDLGTVDHERIHLILPEQTFVVRDTPIRAFPVPHDAADPVGFRIGSRSGDVGIATDLGSFAPAVREHLKGCRTVHLEANYDEAMLWNGPYTMRLKRRIAGADGHLSNPESAQAALWLLRHGTEAFALSHLSRENNLPHLALSQVCELLEAAGARLDRDVRVRTSERYACSAPFVFE